MKNDLEKFIEDLLDNLDKNPELSEEEKKEFRDYWETNRSKYAAAFEIVESKYDIILEKVESLENSFMSFDPYWGFMSNNEATEAYQSIIAFVDESMELSLEEKSKLKEIIYMKINQLPQKDKERQEKFELEEKLEEEKRGASWEKAKLRYEKLSAWKKVKCMINRKTPRSLVPKTKLGTKKIMPDMSTSEINKLYGGDHER